MPPDVNARRTFLEPQSPSGDKTLKFSAVRPQNGALQSQKVSCSSRLCSKIKAHDTQHSTHIKLHTTRRHFPKRQLQFGKISDTLPRADIKHSNQYSNAERKVYDTVKRRTLKHPRWRAPKISNILCYCCLVRRRQSRPLAYTRATGEVRDFSGGAWNTTYRVQNTRLLLHRCSDLASETGRYLLLFGQ